MGRSVGVYWRRAKRCRSALGTGGRRSQKWRRVGRSGRGPGYGSPGAPPVLERLRFGDVGLADGTDFLPALKPLVDLVDVE